jgi:hypothetical protein
MATTKIFRYKLCDEIINLIGQFAKIHQLADRHMYKEAWAMWLTDHQDLVEREVARLQQLDYVGDILDKMFKAGRYYFREKKVAPVQAQQAPAAVQEKKKRDYIVMDPLLIQAMDLHLKGQMQMQDFKPALAYVNFCAAHTDLLAKETARLLLQTIDKAKITAKIKKTYKNRYFILEH